MKYIPSPPPISNLSNSAEVIDPGFMLSNLREVHAVKSWGSRGSGQSTNDEKCSVHSNDTDGIVFIDHNLRRTNQLNQQRVRRSMSALKLSDLGSNSVSGTGSTVGITGVGPMGEEVDWEHMSRNETLSMILKPMPQSIRKNTKKRKTPKGSRVATGKGDEEEASFSDWSNVSSNIGIPSHCATPH